MKRLYARLVSVFVTLMITLFAFPSFSFASPPLTIGYQGILKDSSGNLQTGTFSITFRLYGALSGGSALWTETQSLSVSSGYVVANLGSVTPFGSSVSFTDPLYLTIDVSGDGEMSPRVPLNTVPYAYTASGIAPTLPTSATGGRMYYDLSSGSLRYYDAVANFWRDLTLGTTTATLQTITANGSTTSLPISFGGGTSTAGLSLSSTLNVQGSSALQDVTFANATGTSATTTNLFATNGNVSSLSFANGTSTSWLGFSAASGSSIFANTATLGSLTVSSLSSSSIVATNATTTNLAFTTGSGSSLLIAGQSVCLANGVNCPTIGAGTSTLQTVTTNGATTTNLLYALGGIQTLNLTATGTLDVTGLSTLGNVVATNVTSTSLFASTVSSTNLSAHSATLGSLTLSTPLSISGLTVTSATATDATTTNLFATNGVLTNGVITNATITNGTASTLSFTNGTSTAWFGFATASGTTLNALSAAIASLSSPNVSLSGGTINNVVIGGVTPAAATVTTLIATTATSTNLFANSATFGNLTLSAPLSSLSFTNGTSTSWLGFATASGTSLFTSSLSVAGQSVCLANGVNCPGAAATTATLQTITANGATTTNLLYALGGIQTLNLTATGTLDVTGLSTLGNVVATNVTSTNAFATTASSTNLSFINATGIALVLSGTLSLQGIRLDATGASALTSGAYLVGVFDAFSNSSATTVQAALTDLDTAISAVSSSANGLTLQAVTTNGNTTNQPIIFAGGTSTGALILSSALTVQGSSSLQGLTFTNTTGTSATTTNLFATNGILTNGTITNATVSALSFVNGTSTSWLGFATASGTTLNASSAAIASLSSPNVSLSGGTINNVAIGGTTPAAGAFTTLTGTTVTSTNLFANSATLGSLTLSAPLSSLSFANGTSTSWFGFGTASGTSLFTSSLSVAGQSVCLANGTNCPGTPATTATLQMITTNGATTTNLLYALGGIQTSSLTATGTLDVTGASTLGSVVATNVTSTTLFASTVSSTSLAANSATFGSLTLSSPLALSDVTVTNATATNATTTNLFVTNGILTNGTITNGTVSSLSFGNGTSTSWFGFAAASGTTLNALSASVASLSSSNVSLSGGTINNTVIGGVTPAAATVTTLTGTTVTSTNLFANSATFGNLTVSAPISSLSFTNGTSTSWLGFATASGTSLFTSSLSVAGQSVCLANGTNCPGAAASTATLQTITTNGATTTNILYALGGIQTLNLTATGTLDVTGLTTLANLSFTNATGGTLALSNALSVQGIRLDATGASALTSGAYLVGVFDAFTNSSATTVQAALTDLDAAISTVSSSANGLNLQAVTTNGNTTNQPIIFAGGTSTGALILSSALTVQGSSSLQGLTFTNTTGTSATTTNLFATNGILTNGTITNGTVSSLSFANGTSTSWLGFAAASGTTLNALSASIASLSSPNVSISGGTINNTVIGGVTPAAATFTTLTGTTVTSTNLFANSATLGSLTLSAPLSSLSFANGTSTSWFGFGTASGTSLFTSSLSVAGQSVCLANGTNCPGTPATTATLQMITTNGATTTNLLYALGGIQTLNLVATGTLDVSGASTLQGVTFTSATGTSATTTNLFTTNGTLTNGTISNLSFTNGTSTSWLGFATASGTSLNALSASLASLSSLSASISGGTINGTIIGGTTPAAATITTLTGTTVTSTNLFANSATLGSLTISAPLSSLSFANGTSTSWLGFATASGTSLFTSSLSVAGQSVCLLNGTNCPGAAATTATLQTITTNGATTTNLLYALGSVQTLNLTATGTLDVSGVSTLQGLTFTSATGTSATTTNLFATNGILTNGTITNGTVSSLSFTNGTSTSWLGFTTASGTTINAIAGTISTLTATNGTITNTTSTNAFATSASSTNLSFTTGIGGALSLASTLTVQGASSLQDFTFANATGTSATTTNLFTTNGRMQSLVVTSTTLTGDAVTITSPNLTSGHGLLIDANSSAMTSGAAFFIRDNGATRFLVGSASSQGFLWNASGTQNAYLNFATSSAQLQIQSGNLIVGNSTATAQTSLLTGKGAYIQGSLEVDGGARIDSTMTMGAANSVTAVPWTNTNLATSTNTYAVFAMQAYNGYLYAGQTGGSAGDGDVQMCDPSLAGSATICDSASDWSRVLDNASASSVTSMVVYKNRLYEAEGIGTGVIRFCNPANAGNASQCDSASDWTVATTTSFTNIRQLMVYGGYLYASADSNASGTPSVLGCNPSVGGNVNDCDNASDWVSVTLPVTATAYTQAPGLVTYLNRMYALVSSGASGGGDLYSCIPTAGTNAELCDASGDWSRTLDNTQTFESAEAGAVYNGFLYLGMGQSAGNGDLIRCDTGSNGDDALCDNVGDLSLVINNAATLRVPALISFDGSLFVGYEGASAGEGRIIEYRESYTSTTNSGAGFQSTLSFAVYNNYLYAGRGNAPGNGQVFYFRKGRTLSNNIAFEAGSSTASLWLSNESHNFQGEGADTNIVDTVFKFSTGIITEAGSYDLAEMYPTAEPGLEAGDVVALDETGGGSIRKTAGVSEPAVLGVVSTKPGFTLSAEAHEGMLPIALAGRVPVKVSLENGDIHIGDTLVPSSLPGVAMKGLVGGSMVGMALQNLASSTAPTGTIMMVVQKGVFLGANSSSTASLITSTTSTVFLQPTATVPEVSLPAGSLIAQGIGVQTLVVADATVTGSLTVFGATTLHGPLAVDAPFSGTVAIPPKVSDTTIQGSFGSAPRVLLTPEVTIPQEGSPLHPEDLWDGVYYLTNVSSTGFTIHIPHGGYCLQYETCPIQVSFHWLALIGSASSTAASLPEVLPTSSDTPAAPSPSSPVILDARSTPLEDPVSIPPTIVDPTSSTIEAPSQSGSVSDSDTSSSDTQIISP